MSNFHLLLLEAEESPSNFGFHPYWTDPELTLLDNPARVRKILDEDARYLQARPFTTESLLLGWFPVLDKCWAISLERQHNLNTVLFEEGYIPVGIGLNPTWHWAKGGLIRL